MNKKFHAVFFTDMSTKVWHARPLGAYRLASELRSHGYEVLVIDFFSKWLANSDRLKELLDKVVSDQTLFVGYSGTFFSQYNDGSLNPKTHKEYYGGHLTSWPLGGQQMKQFNDHIRNLNPETKILYGGSQSDALSTELTSSGIDYVVQGLADGVILNIIKRLENKQFIQYTFKNNLRVIDYDLKGHTFDFHNSFTTFHESDCLDHGEVLPIETSRGCLFKCSFCAYPLLGRKKSDPNYHKNITVLSQELKHNYEQWGINRYMFVDDTFNETTEKLQEIKNAIDAAGIKISFSCYLRLDLLARYPEQIDLLRDMGMQSCFLGIETLNKQSAQAIGKKSNIEDVKQTLELARASWKDQVVIFASFIAGLPHDSKDTINQWMQWVYDRSDLIDGYVLVSLSLNKDKSFASDVSSNPEKYGYVMQPNYGWENNVGFTQYDSRRLAEHWMEKSWKDSRLSVSGWEMLGMQNLGYSYKDLYLKKLNQLPYADFAQQYAEKFLSYQQQLFNYIGN
jgi:radical SAM superfamily enzyme YgiQ (UPF0313 family)